MRLGRPTAATVAALLMAACAPRDAETAKTGSAAPAASSPATTGTAVPGTATASQPSPEPTAVPPTPGPTTSVAVQGGGAPVGGGDRPVWTGACAQIVAQMRTALAALPAACTTDAQCTCYVGGVEDVTRCGDVSDLGTARKIDALQERFDKAQCDYQVSCKPRECRAACVQGHCGSR